MGLMAAGAAAVGLAGCGGDDTSCGAGTVRMGDTCVTELECATGTSQVGNECVPDGSVVCGAGTTYNEDTGMCDPDVAGCGEGLVLDDAGNCVDPSALWDPDVTEGAEPNGFEGTPAQFTLPAEGGSVTLGGCINPTDIDGDGAADEDFDVFLFQAAGTMVLDITVEGTGGLSGGFVVVPTDAELSEAGWLRFGANLVDETAQRELFLPKAGTYALAVTDGRSLFAGPAGNPDACYLATVEVKPIPAATPITDEPGTGVLGDGVQVFSYDPADGDLLFNALVAESEGALGDFVQLVNGTYVSSGDSGRDNGAPTELFIDGLADDDTVTLVVDPVLNISLDVIPFELSVTDPDPLELPSDGSTVTVTNDGLQFRWMYFDASAGDILELDIGTTADQYMMFIIGPGLTAVTEPCPQGTPCTGDLDNIFVQLPADGTYYLRLFDLSDPQPASFDVTASFDLVQPTPLEAGTPVDDAVLGDSFARWFEFDAQGQDWVFFTGEAPGFSGDMNVSFFERGAVGRPGVDFGAVDSFVGDGGENDRVLIADDDTYLVRVTDGGAGDDAASTFDLAVTQRVFQDLGTFDADTPIALEDETIPALDVGFYLARGVPGQAARLTATPDAADILLGRAGRLGVIEVLDDGAAGEAESTLVVLSDGVNMYLAFGVLNDSVSDATVDIDIVASAPITETSAPGSTIPDNDPAGLDDQITVSESCTMIDLSVDVDITHAFNSDITVSLTSPAGTTVVLHTPPFFGSANVIGNYPNTLTPAESLDAFLGEDTSGDWTLSIVDSFASDAGTLNSWGVNLLCAP